MESSQATLTKIAQLSQDLRATLSPSASCGNEINEPDDSRAQLCQRLDSIVISSRAILEILNESTANAISHDEQLQGWISANGPVKCLLGLDKMRKIIAPDPTWSITCGLSRILHAATSTASRKKIRKAIKVLDGHRECFECLLSSSVWDHKVTLLRQARLTQVDSRNSETRGKLDASRPMTVHGPVGTPLIVSVGHSGFGPIVQLPVISVRTLPPIKCAEERDLSAFKYRFESLDDIRKLDVILRWLNSSRSIEKYEDTLSQRQTDTCTWLPETPDFKAWLAGESSFLWLQGKAGSGKSVLIASVIERLEKNIRDEPLAYFYCDFGNEESMDPTQVMRSLLYQLLDQYRHSKLKKEALLIIHELEEEKRKGDAVLKHITRLPSLVSRVAQQFLHPPRIVIDALDECKEIDRLLRALLLLKAGEVRLLVSSRPILAIKHKFRGLASISLDTMSSAISADIKLHIQREVDSHTRLAFFDPVLKQKIHTTLEQKADGMFRWVECQLDTLKGCVTLRDLHETLDNIPIGLEATYERILLKIDQQKSEGKVARRALAWLVTASRSLTLTEMIEALSVDFEKRAFNREIAPMHKYALLDVLGSLVVHNDETDIVNLSHFSVKEYLVDECTRMKLPAYHISLQEAHKQVFQQCMCYLTISLNPESPLESNGIPQSQHVVTVTLIPSRPLLDYVFSCAFDHLAYLEPTDSTIINSMVILQSEIQNQPMAWKHMCALAAMYHQYKPWITPDHDFITCVLISLFPEPFLRAFLGRTSLETKYNSNPLVHAVHFEKADHARTMLLQGVDVNASGCEMGPDGVERTLPLMVALRRGSDVLVDLFLKEGSAAIPRQVYSTIFSTEICCEYSPRHVLSLIQADEFAEWVADVGTHSAETLFHALQQRRCFQPHVTEEHSLAVIRRLVQIGMFGHNLTSEQFLLTVASAVSGGCISLLRYLISIGAPIPSGVSFSELVNGSVEDLAHQGIDMKTITAKGDAALHKVLGQCPGSSECWELGCSRCKDSKATLLTTLGRSDERTLAGILIVLQSLLSWSTSNTIEFSHVLRRLKIICTAAGILLRSIHRSFSNNTALSDDELRWLSGKEPNECLDILRRMLDLSASHTPTESAGVSIAKLFNQQEKHFRFLLKADVDNVVDTRGSDQILVPEPQSKGSCNEELPVVRERLPRKRPCSSDDFGDVEEGRIGICDRIAESDAPCKRPRKRISHPQESCPILGRQVSYKIDKIPWTSADVVFVGQTGAGKSTLINMIMGVPNNSQSAARVGRSARAVTLHSASYSCTLVTGLRCQLWDTRGLDDITDGTTVFRHAGIELKKEKSIVMWCIPASKIDFPLSRTQVYDAYKKRSTGLFRAVLSIVVTQVDPSENEWESKCKHQFQQLGLKVGHDEIGGSDVLLLRVRRHRGVSSPEYIEDSKALRERIAQLAYTSISSPLP